MSLHDHPSSRWWVMLVITLMAGFVQQAQAQGTGQVGGTPRPLSPHIDTVHRTPAQQNAGHNAQPHP